MVDVATGDNKWNVEVRSAYFIDRNLAVADNDVIVVRKHNVILAVNRENGNIIQSHPDVDEDSLYFDVITDFITGSNYYYTNSGIIYWKN